MNYLPQKQPGAKRTFHITKDGLDSLRKKLDLIMRERLEAIKRIRSLDEEARDDPLALSEEVRRLELAEAEVIEINDVLRHAEPIISSLNPTSVQIGSKVTLEMNSRMSVYTVVSSPEVDLSSNKISQDSPLGMLLLNKQRGEQISITTKKDKKCTYTIIDIQ